MKKLIYLVMGLVIMATTAMTDMDTANADGFVREETHCEVEEEVTIDSVYRVDGKKEIYFMNDLDSLITCYDGNGNVVDGFVDKLYDTEHELDNMKYRFGTFTMNYVYKPSNYKYKESSGTFILHLYLAPRLLYKSRTMIVLDSIEGCEYSIDGETWQKRPTFKKLEPDTEYTFYQREKDNEDSVITEAIFKTKSK